VPAGCDRHCCSCVSPHVGMYVVWQVRACLSLLVPGAAAGVEWLAPAAAGVWDSSPRAGHHSLFNAGAVDYAIC